MLAVQTVVLTACALKASRRLHAQMLDTLVAAPMSFFDNTSTGLVLNRFLQVSTRVLGRRTEPFPPFLSPNRVSHGFTPRS